MSEVQETRQATKPRPSAGLMSSFSLFVLLPSLVGAIYFGLIASDRYVAEARYAIRTGSQAPMGGFIESIVTSSLGGNTRQDAEIVRSFVLSLEMLEQLGRRFDLRAHYESSEIDWLSRLDPAASQEDFLEYLEDRIEVTIDPESSISTLRVHAFDPEAARVIADQILDLSEQLVNTMSERISEDMLRFARNELDRTEAQVLEATTAMTRFRKETRSIDPGEETSAVLGIITELETSLANTQTELIEVRSVMRSGSPKIRNLETRVAALKHQVLEERDRLANTHDTDLTSLIDQYQPLLLEQELSKQRYASALNSLEIARAEAQRQQSYLLAFVAPQRPTEATQPERVWMIATVFACAFLIYGIGGLIWSAIKDHMRL
jgi:capsular polysaccharide transport system permease protein